MPSDEAKKVLDEVCAAMFPGGGKQDREAAATVIDEALAKRDAEIADWLGKRLRGHERAFAKAVEFRHDDHQTHYAARAREVEEIESGIRSGEYRKDDHG